MVCQVLQVQKVIQVTSVNLVLEVVVVDLVLKDKRVYQKRNENRSKTKLFSLSLSRLLGAAGEPGLPGLKGQQGESGHCKSFLRMR